MVFCSVCIREHGEMKIPFCLITDTVIWTRANVETMIATSGSLSYPELVVY